MPEPATFVSERRACGGRGCGELQGCVFNSPVKVVLVTAGCGQPLLTNTFIRCRHYTYSFSWVYMIAIESQIGINESLGMKNRRSQRSESVRQSESSLWNGRTG